MVQPNTAALEAKLKAAPAYQQAVEAYRQAVLNTPNQTEDEFMQQGGKPNGASPDALAAFLDLNKTVQSILSQMGVADAKSYVTDPFGGVVPGLSPGLNYRPDHSGRNTLLGIAGMIGGGIGAEALAGLAGGAAAAAPAVQGGSTLAANLGLGSALPGVSAVLPSAATAGSVGSLAPALTSGTSASSLFAAPATQTAKAASSWLLPSLFNTVIPTAGSIVGTVLQSNANKNAAKLEAEGIDKALAFEKQQYGDLVGRLDPYIQSGATSTDRMAQLLGLPARTQTTATLPAKQTTPTMAQLPIQQPAQALTVRLQAPDGSIREKPVNELEKWLQKGAKVVS